MHERLSQVVVGADDRAVSDADALLHTVHNRLVAWGYPAPECAVSKRGPMVSMKWTVGQRALAIMAMGGGRCEVALFPDKSGAAMIGFIDLGCAADLAAWFAATPASAHTVLPPSAPAEGSASR